MLTLEEIIDFPEGRETKRAIAVKMIIQGFEVKDICSLLGVSDSFVSKWKIIYENEGASALRLNYKGRTGFLTEFQRDEIFFYLKDKPHYTVEELRDLIELRYDVVYQSKQSYYDILKEAGLSWHKTEAVNPKRDEAKVLLKREEIKEKLEEHQEEIKEGQAIVFAEDESHLLAGDTTGYVWGQRNETIEVPIKNIKDRQTYYGALNLHNKDFFVTPSDSGNGENTVLFIQHLQALHPNKKLIIIWDGASYHCCDEVKSYLSEVNKGLEKKDWKVTCILFAPHAPDQNPVEDAWLRGKNYLRKHFYENKTFNQVKDSFINFLNRQIFDFKKIEWYLKIPQPV
jgi:putative transposase